MLAQPSGLFGDFEEGSEEYQSPVSQELVGIRASQKKQKEMEKKIPPK